MKTFFKKKQFQGVLQTEQLDGTKCFNGFHFAYFRKVKKGTLLIDSSTIDPSVSKEMALAAEKMGAVFMDAPVSGGNVSPKERKPACDFIARLFEICMQAV